MKTPDAQPSHSNDVSLREHVTATINALDRHLTGELDGLRRETSQANDTAKESAKATAKEAEDRLTSHNGLIAQMQEQASHFASQESLDEFKKTSAETIEEFKKTNDTRLKSIEKFQYMITGALVFVGAVGLTTLVKVFSPTIPVVVDRPLITTERQVPMPAVP